MISGRPIRRSSPFCGAFEQGSPEFTTWWETHEIRGVAAGRKLLRHPTKGVRCFEHASFQANDDPALKLVIYTLV